MAWNEWYDLWGMDPFDWSSLLPSSVRHGTGRPYPAVNLYGNNEKLVLTSEVPGVSLDDLDIKIHGRTLTLKGKRDALELSEGECFTCHERGHGEFSRSITLPYLVESDKVEAGYDKGVLRIELPRAEKEKPKKIKVAA